MILQKKTRPKSADCISFATFFDAYSEAYGARRDGKKAENVWKRLSSKQRQEAYDGIERYREICRQENISMCYAQGYLNQERWKDEPRTAKDGQAKQAQKQDSGAAGKPIPAGWREPAEEELSRLRAFKTALRQKTARQPWRWEEFQRDIVDNLTMPCVKEKDGRVYICVERDGRRERITTEMIDYYDSYLDFFNLLSEHFDITKIFIDL